MIEKKKFPYGYLLLSLLLLLIGGCFLAFNTMFNVLAITLGIVLIVFSLILFAQTLLDAKRDFMFVCKIISALCGIACAIVTIILREHTINIIANILCLLLIMDGSFKLGKAFSSRKFTTVKFWVTIVLSSALIVISFLMSKFIPDTYDPSTNEGVVQTTLCGILIFADGLLNFLYAFFRSGFNTPNESPDAPITPNEEIVPLVEPVSEEPAVIAEDVEVTEEKPETPVVETPEEEPEAPINTATVLAPEAPTVTPIEEKPDEAPVQTKPEEKPDATVEEPPEGSGEK